MFSYIKSLTDEKRSLKNWIKDHKIHLIVWAIFMIYESVVLGLYLDHFENVWNYAIHYAINILLFYFHAHYVLPKALKIKEYAFWRAPLFVILQLALYVTCLFFLDDLLAHYTNILNVKDVEFNASYIFRSLYRGSYFVGFGTGYYFLIIYISEKKRANELEKIRLNNVIKAELAEKELVISRNAFLRAQITPHLLFNTLDFIYHHTRKESPVGAEAIAILSDIMRYATDTSYIGEYTPLGEEIEQVETLIRLYQLKSSNELYIQFEYDEKIKEVLFIPLILTTLAENIFKHGTLSSPENPAFISICTNEHTLFIKTSNLINSTHNSRGFKSGLSNVKKRLEYSYGDKSSLEVFTDSKNYFNVSLSVKTS